MEEEEGDKEILERGEGIDDGVLAVERVDGKWGKYDERVWKVG